MYARNRCLFLGVIALFSIDSLQARIVFSSIDTPGFYKLADNLTNSVTITVSNVTFDLGGHTIAASNGIIINSNLNQIVIKNGAIDASIDGIIANSGCTNITLENITAKNATRGINFENVTGGTIKNCEMTTNTTGLELDNSHNIFIDNSVANCNTHAGYCLLSSTTCSIQNCQALSTGEGNVDIEGTTVFGFVSRDGYGNVFERCIANSTQALTVTDSSSLIAGFAFRGTEKCSKIIDSESSNSTTDPEEFTVPYGILLEGTIDSMESVAEVFTGATNVRAVHWSPNGKYVAVTGQGLTGGTNDEFQVFRFDPVAQTLTSVGGALNGGNIFAVNWSPTGQYIAVGGNAITGGTGDQFQIFKFDQVSETLTNLTGVLAGVVLGIDWSADEEYIAVVGQSITGGTGDEFQIFKFDRAAETLTSVAGDLAGSVLGVNWSPDGQYIAVGGDIASDLLQIFTFDRATNTLVNVATAISSGGGNAVNALNWSPDGQYIAVGGTTLGDELQIFTFDRATNTLTNVAGTLTGTVNAVNWAANGEFIVVGGVGFPGNEVQVVRFDRASNTLSSIAELLAGTVQATQWSPDGHYIAVGGQSISASNEFQILTGLQFPEKNVIKNNTVYCNSGNQFPGGVGISGSSIANMIIGNTSYSNPIPRGQNAPIVSSNYEFVTNVFNPLFGLAPSDVQNISLAGCDPICQPADISARIDRVEKLFESLIDNLL